MKFFLTDDDSDDRELFVEAISDVDPAMECETASFAAEMLEKLESNAYQKPNLIFLDINLPEMSGWECLTLLKKKDHLKDIPVVMYSTSSHARDRLIAKDLGAIGLITKPSNFHELKKILAQVAEFVKKNDLMGITKMSATTTKI